MSIEESNLALATKFASSTFMQKMTELTFPYASFADLHFLLQEEKLLKQ